MRVNIICFINLKKYFDVLTRDHRSRCMEKLKVSSEFMLAISWTYEHVTCPLLVLIKDVDSHKLYVKYVFMKRNKWLLTMWQKKALKKFPIGNVVIMLLLYVDDEVLFVGIGRVFHVYQVECQEF